MSRGELNASTLGFTAAETLPVFLVEFLEVVTLILLRVFGQIREKCSVFSQNFESVNVQLDEFGQRKYCPLFYLCNEFIY